MRFVYFLLYTSYSLPENEKDSTDWIILLFFFLPFLLSFFYLFKKGIIFNRREVIFNKDLPLNNENLFEANIRLAAYILKVSKDYSKKKLQYIHDYFKRNFPENYENLTDNLSYAYKSPIKINSITSWIRAFIQRKEERIKIIYFLSGICFTDGNFSSSEIQRLKKIALKIRLTSKEFDHIISNYKTNNYQHQHRKKTRSNSNKRSNSYKSRKTTRTYKYESKKSINCKILGVPSDATFQEIKRAYRKLVKLNHPDRFHNATKEEQSVAKSKFIKIQKAYEYLEMIMK